MRHYFMQNLVEMRIDPAYWWWLASPLKVNFNLNIRGTK